MCSAGFIHFILYEGKKRKTIESKPKNVIKLKKVNQC